MSELPIQALELGEDEIALRDLFLTEYFKDFSQFYAAIRCGFPATIAVEWGKRLYDCPYVQTRLQEMTREAPADDGVQAKRDRELIMNTYRNVMATGTKTEQVAAASKLALMRGFEKPDTIGDATTELANVMREFAKKAPA